MPSDGANQLTLWSLFSLLGGTIISAIVSYLLQRNSFAEARGQKQQDKLDERKTLGLNLLHKMMRIASTLGILKKHLDDSLSRLPPDQRDKNIWRYVQPIAAVPDRVKFTTEELTSLMLLDRDLFNDMGPFDDIHNHLLELFTLYRINRTALTDTLPATMQGIVGRVELDQNQMQKIAPRVADLDFLVAALVQTTEKDSTEAWALLDRLATSLNAAFALKLKLEPK
jgi:hypothetical protein